MEKVLTITKEMMLKAKSYMPLALKVGLSEQIAEQSLYNMKTAKQNQEGLKMLAMPEIKGENVALKNMLIMNSFLSFYFDLKIERKDTQGNKMDEYTIYDYCAGGNPISQIERFKKDEELKCKAFDILTDYKEFRKMVDIQIHNLKENNNDIVGRLTSAIQLLSTPENLKELTELLKQKTEEYSDKVIEIKKIQGQKRKAEMQKGIDKK